MTDEQEKPKPAMTCTEAEGIIDTMIKLYAMETGDTAETASEALNTVVRTAKQNEARRIQALIREGFAAAIARTSAVFTELDLELHRRGGT